MPARATSSGTISFGLVSIPVKVYTATQAKSVRFSMLHETDKDASTGCEIHPPQGRREFVVEAEPPLLSILAKSLEGCDRY